MEMICANLSCPKKFRRIPWQTIRTNARTQYVLAQPSPEENTAAHHVKVQAKQLNSIATADTMSVAATSNRLFLASEP
jgi:hypothetical protein